MPDNYIEHVYTEYQKRKKKHELSQALLDPTPAGLRTECLNVYEERNRSNEHIALRSFFGPLINEVDYVNRISSCDIDLFRPVVNFANGITKNPNRKVAEILEWLMMNKVIIPPVEPIKFNYRKIIIISIGLFILEIGAIFLWKFNREYIPQPSATEKCMYWSGAHYEPVDCNASGITVPVVKLDIKKLNGFKKILLKDGMTNSDIGKVWYSGQGTDKHEYFTDSGMHPVDTVKRLKPLSSYILAHDVSSHRLQLNIILGILGSILITILVALIINSVFYKKA